jgi:hypothetical protein
MSDHDDTAAAIGRLEARLERMEGSLERLTRLLDMLPGMRSDDTRADERRAALADAVITVIEL